MNKTTTRPTKPVHGCEFDELRNKMRRCVRRSCPRPSRMVGIEVAYLALADWLAAGGSQPNSQSSSCGRSS